MGLMQLPTQRATIPVAVQDDCLIGRMHVLTDAVEASSDIGAAARVSLSFVSVFLHLVALLNRIDDIEPLRPDEGDSAPFGWRWSVPLRQWDDAPRTLEDLLPCREGPPPEESA